LELVALKDGLTIRHQRSACATGDENAVAMLMVSQGCR